MRLFESFNLLKCQGNEPFNWSLSLLVSELLMHQGKWTYVFENSCLNVEVSSVTECACWQLFVCSHPKHKSC